jgi:hypothetical protein
MGYQARRLGVEMSGRPNPRYHVQDTGKLGLPKGREPYGDGAPIVVRGRENRPHGEVGQVIR